MNVSTRFRPVSLCAASALALLAACNEPLDYDLRGNLGGFSTADAALNATEDRPKPDSRGVITYPTYQVAVARRGDTVADVANRLGFEPAELAKYNGIGPTVSLRPGEVLALPRSVGPDSSAVDIESLAGDAIDSAPDTTPVQTSDLAPAKPAAQSGPEPVRHKVTRGETAYTISRLYQVPVKSLAEWNGLGPDFAIREGQYLLIPVASQAAPQNASAGTAAGATAAIATTAPGAGTPTPTPPSATTPLPDEKVAPAAQANTTTTPVGEPTTTSTAKMGFPVKGNIIRAYSKGRNDGIDIAAAPGSSVNAAADGTIAAITADADQIPIIVVRHPDNLLTVYANVDKIVKKKGDPVKRGQKLASLRGGDDAYVHFEVREGFDSVNPMPYLE